MDIGGTMNDIINHPSHYTDGKIEVIDFIDDKKLNFERGNAIKYICRAGKKDKAKEIEDLQKAAWYINHEIERLQKNSLGKTAKRAADSIRNLAESLDSCVACGEVVPEGRQVCPACEQKGEKQ